MKVIGNKMQLRKSKDNKLLIIIFIMSTEKEEKMLVFITRTLETFLTIIVTPFLLLTVEL
jgi:hypothetical protein